MRTFLHPSAIVAAAMLTTPGLATTAAELPRPIAHWRLDDTDGTARDAVGDHHGMIHGAVPRPGRIGGGLLFDRAKRDHVSVAYAPDLELSTFTVSAWVKLTKDPTFSGVIGTRLGNALLFDIKVNADKVHGDIGDGTRWIDTRINFYKDDVGTNGQGGDLPLDRWFLITFVIDSAAQECRLYLDDDRKKTIPFTGTPKLITAGHKLHIGNTGAGEFMDGVIDEVRIWKQALGDDDVRRLAAP